VLEYWIGRFLVVFFTSFPQFIPSVTRISYSYKQPKSLIFLSYQIPKQTGATRSGINLALVPSNPRIESTKP